MDTDKKLVLELTNDEAHLLLTFACHGAYAFNVGGVSQKDSAYPEEIRGIIMHAMFKSVEDHIEALTSLNRKIDMLADRME